MLINIPAAEIPVNNKNFLVFSFVFCLKVKNINTSPNKEKTIKGIKKTSDPLNAGIKKLITIKIKITTKTQNVILRDFFICFYSTKKSVQ